MVPTRPATTGGYTVTQTRETPRRFSAQDEKTVRSANALGTMYLNRGEYDAAIQEYLNGLRVDPRNPELLKKIQQARKAKAAEERLTQ